MSTETIIIVLEAAGVLTRSRRLKTEGRAEAVAGKVQNQIGQVEKVLGG